MPTTKETQNRSKIGASTTQIPIKVDSVGNQSSLPKPTAKTIIHNEKVYYIHPIYTNYAASKDGYIINLKRLIPRKGRLHSTGYFQTDVYHNGRKKLYQSHRFVYESINGLIPCGLVVDHINSNKDDNHIDNLQLVTRQENCAKYGKERTISHLIKNVDATTDYDSQLTDKQKNATDKAFNRMVKKMNRKTDLHFNGEMSTIDDEVKNKRLVI